MMMITDDHSDYEESDAVDEERMITADDGRESHPGGHGTEDGEIETTSNDATEPRRDDEGTSEGGDGATGDCDAQSRASDEQHTSDVAPRVTVLRDVTNDQNIEVLTSDASGADE